MDPSENPLKCVLRQNSRSIYFKKVTRLFVSSMKKQMLLHNFHLSPFLWTFKFPLNVMFFPYTLRPSRSCDWSSTDKKSVRETLLLGIHWPEFNVMRTEILGLVGQKKSKTRVYRKSFEIRISYLFRRASEKIRLGANLGILNCSFLFVVCF